VCAVGAPAQVWSAPCRTGLSCPSGAWRCIGCARPSWLRRPTSAAALCAAGRDLARLGQEVPCCRLQLLHLAASWLGCFGVSTCAGSALIAGLVLTDRRAGADCKVRQAARTLLRGPGLGVESAAASGQGEAPLPDGLRVCGVFREPSRSPPAVRAGSEQLAAATPHILAGVKMLPAAAGAAAYCAWCKEALAI
jgi:hypothetical protein